MRRGPGARGRAAAACCRCRRRPLLLLLLLWLPLLLLLLLLLVLPLVLLLLLLRRRLLLFVCLLGVYFSASAEGREAKGRGLRPVCRRGSDRSPPPPPPRDGGAAAAAPVFVSPQCASPGRIGGLGGVRRHPGRPQWVGPAYLPPASRAPRGPEGGRSLKGSRAREPKNQRAKRVAKTPAAPPENEGRRRRRARGRGQSSAWAKCLLGSLVSAGRPLGARGSTKMNAASSSGGELPSPRRRRKRQGQRRRRGGARGWASLSLSRATPV